MTGHPPTRHLTSDELVLVYFDEFTDRCGAEAHLAICESCRRELASLRHTLALVADHQDAGRAGGLRAGDVGTDSARGGRPDAGRLAPLVRASPPGGGGGRGVHRDRRVRGWPLDHGPAPAPDDPIVADGTALAPERVLLGAAGEHLDRSQRVLVELLNTEPDGPLPVSERERAADLVAASRLIRQSASDAGESALADVLGDLERVLMELANGTDNDTAAELRQLRERIESRGILFRMRVVGSDMRERQKASGPPVS